MNRGFTIIELLLVVSIVAVISGLSVPFYGRFLTQNAVSNTVDQLVASFHKAQFYAMMSRKSNASGWGVNFGSQTITLYQGATYASRNTALDETYTVNNNITVSGMSDVNFSRISGVPSSSVTVTITGNGNSKAVTLNAVGMVTR